MKTKAGKSLFYLLSCWIILSGCSAYPWSVLKGQSPRPLRTAQPETKFSGKSLKAGEAMEGSLWDPEQSQTYFFQDPKATRVGDIVRVQIVENAKGSKDAATKVGRTSTVAGATGLSLGIPKNTTDNLNVNASYTDQFAGDGATSRDQSLTAVVPSEVTEVLPNGNLVLYGRREVLINREKALISLTGIIRPEDISAQNTILSTAMADANIEYTGRGVLSDKQQPGWLVRLLNWIWPF